MDESLVTKRINDLNGFIDNEMKKADWIKIVCIGESQAGKTCLIKSLCENQFDKIYQETIGVDYGFKLLKNGPKDVRITFWDLAGHQSYLKVRRELYSQTDVAVSDTFNVPDTAKYKFEDCLNIFIRDKADYSVFIFNMTEICLLVYDTTTIPPLSNFVQWKNELYSCGGKNSKLVVIGNKIDLSHKKSLINDVAEWAQKNTTGHYITSSATGEGIEDMFKDILDDFYSAH